jgi:transcriptional regulator with XRE-family HTH domain
MKLENDEIIEDITFVSLLKEIMQQKNRLPSQLALDIDVSHATVSRWLAGKDAPNVRSCYKLAEYSGLPLDSILFKAGHIPAPLK